MLKKWRIALILVATLALSIFVSACGGETGTTSQGSTPTDGGANTSNTAGAFNCVQGSITASGSTALQPYVQKVAEQYQSKCSGARITVLPGGSKKGLTDAQNGTSDIGNSDVPATADQPDLVDHQVAVVIFAVIVHPDAGVTDLKISDIQGIYTGKIKNWKEVGGADKPIVVVSRPATSGTRATFKNYMLDGQNETPSQAQNLTSDSTGTVVQTVTQTSGSIGYVSLGGAKEAGSKITILKIDGKEATAANVKTNDYKFWNIEHMYTKGQPTGLTKAFLDYMLSDDAGKVADELNFVKITEIPENIRATHNK